MQGTFQTVGRTALASPARAPPSRPRGNIVVDAPMRGGPSSPLCQLLRFDVFNIADHAAEARVVFAF